MYRNTIYKNFISLTIIMQCRSYIGAETVRDIMNVTLSQYAHEHPYT